MLLQMYIGLHVKYPFFFQILIKLEFSRHIFEKSSIWNAIKSPPVGAELFHADRHNKA